MKDRREKNNKVSYPLIAIVGPTASGKSALAMEIATKFNAEIICADSRTVYKGMDIGTAKPSPADRQLVKHHLLDVVYPGQSFNAAQFKALTLTTIEDIAKRGKLSLTINSVRRLTRIYENF
jgi:tRNA dimethylallyltransferase